MDEGLQFIKAIDRTRAGQIELRNERSQQIVLEALDRVTDGFI